MSKNKIEVGSRVQYKAAFLRSIGCYTGDLPFAKGTVKELIPLGSNFLANIDWGNPNVPEKVITQNLKRIGQLESV